MGLGASWSPQARRHCLSGADVQRKGAYSELSHYSLTTPSELAIRRPKMFSFGCGLCRPQREQAAAASAGPRQPEAPLAHPTQQMLRSKSERILQVQTAIEPLMHRSQSMTLLEASQKRLLAAQAAATAAEAEQQLAADGSAAMQFVQQYMQAIKESNTRWVRGRGHLLGPACPHCCMLAVAVQLLPALPTRCAHPLCPPAVPTRCAHPPPAPFCTRLTAAGPRSLG